MQFLKYIPERLHGLAELIWEHEMHLPGAYTVLPSGRTELLLPFEPVVSLEAFKITAADNPVNNASFFLSGLHTRPLKMAFNRFHTFGIRLKPVAVKALFGLPLYKISNFFVEGGVILKTIHVLNDIIRSSKSFQERAVRVETFLLKKITETPELHTAVKMDLTMQDFSRKKGNNPSLSIEDHLGYSKTHTFRLFNDWFGMSPHNYGKLQQFIRSVEHLHKGNVSLTETGLACGYYDQSHFIRTFHEYANMTPGAYRKQMTAFPGQLFGM